MGCNEYWNGNSKYYFWENRYTLSLIWNTLFNLLFERAIGLLTKEIGSSSHIPFQDWNKVFTRFIKHYWSIKIFVYSLIDFNSHHSLHLLTISKPSSFHPFSFLITLSEEVHQVFCRRLPSKGPSRGLHKNIHRHFFLLWGLLTIGSLRPNLSMNTLLVWRERLYFQKYIRTKLVRIKQTYVPLGLNSILGE